MSGAIHKTRGVVLRWADVSNTSRVVQWLTPDAGRVSTLLKGALRPKSLFLGQYDLFYTCELLYYHRPEHELLLGRECSPLRARPGLRTRWRSAAAASYLAGLFQHICPPGAPHPELYGWLEYFLDELEGADATPPLVFWMELKLLAALGLAPRLTHSPAAGRVRETAPRFTPAHGGLSYAAGAAEEISEPLQPDTQAILARWQAAATPQIVRVVRCTPRQIEDIARLLGLFIRWHLGPPPDSRAAALSILRYPAV